MANILVVEDNSDVRSVLRQALEYVGHDVEAAQDGWGALIGFRRRGADLVILDVATSQPEGHKAISEIRSLSDGVKILAMTGSDESSSEVVFSSASTYGADDVISKPFALIDLLVAVDGLLTEGRLQSIAQSM